MKRTTTMFALLLAVAIFQGPATHAASPPGVVNYQGVLRDAADTPLDGNHDMVFRFYNAETGGDEILIDRHTAGDSASVTVTGGLFSVRLGAGAIQDGSGPGVYTSLADLFRDHTDVWIRVEVGGELLDPRVRVVAAAYALNAKNLDGMPAFGFINTTTVGQTKVGRLTIDNAAPGEYGLVVTGMEGAYFEDGDHSGQAWIANGNWGVGGKGNVAGGSFEDLDDSGYAHVGVGDHGIEAYGSAAGGHFENTDSAGYVDVATGTDGIRAYGTGRGGYFESLSYSGIAEVASGDYGVRGFGDTAGGYFRDSDSSGLAYLAYGDYGIWASGNIAGGRFEGAGARSNAWVTQDDYGILANGVFVGGRFENIIGGSFADIGREDYGIRAHGNTAGGTFDDLDSSAYAYVAHGSYKIDGTGSVNFVQNHPEQSDRVIVYAAPEGDEVATYTRGTARLIDGAATVALGETFKWVTNPDIGLTAHLTPHGDCLGLYVDSLTTSELVVRELGGGTSDTVFDYMVYGLRIGFEEASVVQEKTIESFIPSMEDHRDLYEQLPELRQFNALERFKEMAADVRGIDTVDLSRAVELKASIEEYDSEVHGPSDRLLGHEPRGREHDAGEGPQPAPEETVRDDVDPEVDAPEPRQALTTGLTVSGTDDLKAPPRGEPLPASETVEAGQVLALDSENPGTVRPADTMTDSGVIGVAVDNSYTTDGSTGDGALEARVALTGLAECKADAGYGSIQAGDLLTTSPTPGHAMRAIDALPGTILGKALEPLETGTGAIKILVMPR